MWPRVHENNHDLCHAAASRTRLVLPALALQQTSTNEGFFPQRVELCQGSYLCVRNMSSSSEQVSMEHPCSTIMISSYCQVVVSNERPRFIA